MALTTVISDAPDAAAMCDIDEFLRASPYGAYQQSRAWTQVAPKAARRDFIYAVCRDQKVILGVAVVRRTRLAAGRWLATIQRGPVLARPEVLATVLCSLTKALGAAGCCSVQLAPRVRGRDLPIAADTLRAAGFAPLSADRQSLHSATGIVWLDKPEAAILAGFKQRGRRQIRAAERAGVTIRVAQGESDVVVYQSVLDGFARARPDYDMAGLPDAAGQARLIAALGGAMLIAEREGRPIGVHAFVRQADEAIWLSLAATDDEPDVPRTYLLLWHAMRLAREQGCIGYDLAGIPIDEPADAGEAGRWQFKSAFAPTRRILVPMQIGAIQPAAHFVLFGAREMYRSWKKRRRAA